MSSGPFGSSMQIQLPEFNFFPANRGRPYAGSCQCQNVSTYSFLARRQEKSLPTVIKRQKNDQEKASCSAFVHKKAALICLRLFCS